MISIGVFKMQAALSHCVEWNMPIPRCPPSRMEVSRSSRGQDDNLRSPSASRDLGEEQATHMSAKLCTMCMGYIKLNGVFLFNLKEIEVIIHSSLTSRAESKYAELSSGRKYHPVEQSRLS